MPRVLIIESHNCIRILYKSILNELGYEVYAVKDGELALEVYDSLSIKPDLILIDQRNPTTKDLEIIKELQTRNPENKILVLGYKEKMNIERLLETGVKIRTKPVSQKDLISEIDLLMNKADLEIGGIGPSVEPRKKLFNQDEELSNSIRFEMYSGI